MKQQRKRRPSARTKGRRWVALAVIVAVFGLSVWQLVTWGRSELAAALMHTAVAHMGVVEDTASVTATVVRDEQVVVSPASGVVRCLANDGTMVRVGQPIVRIENQKLLSDALHQLSAIESEIERVQSNQATQNQTLAASLQKAQSDLEGALLRLAGAARRADEGSIAKAEKDVARAQANLSTVQLQWQASRTRLAELAAARAAMQSLYDKGVVTITSPAVGFLSYHLDGLEDTLTPAALAYLGQTLPTSTSAAAVADGASVQAGQPLFKVINSTIGYLVIDTPVLPSSGLHAGDSIYWRPTGSQGAMLDATVYSVSSLPSGTRLVLAVPGWSGSDVGGRKLQVSLIMARYRGLVVPATALRVRAGQDGVYVLEKNRVRWVAVQILGRAQGLAAVSGLAEGAMVVTTPDLVYDGMVLP